mmetsp:Transcript_12170/g.24835  ORF Transcript_12170/g.24835 Transcript_12170/m.24835 type:complete len:96 (+) Transcript_12170:1048-1335(+)
MERLCWTVVLVTNLEPKRLDTEHLEFESNFDDTLKEETKADIVSEFEKRKKKKKKKKDVGEVEERPSNPTFKTVKKRNQNKFLVWPSPFLFLVVW